MSRIPDDEIARLKAAVPLTRLAEARGVMLSGQGRNLLGLCPFHDDRTPSLVIDPEQNVWHCLGACNCGGSNIDWVMRDHGVRFRPACEILTAMAGGAPYPARPPGCAPAGALKLSSARRLPNPISMEAEGDALLGQVADFYHRTLTENPLATAQPALDYLKSRKLLDPEAIRHFRLGYADRSLGMRIPDKARREGALIRRRLQALGVMKETGHELFFGALVVPILGAADAAAGPAGSAGGAVVGMYGRMTGAQLRSGTAYHRNLPGPQRAAWNAAGAIDAEGRVILCEAILDGLSFWCQGFRHVTAACGVSAVTEHHRTLLHGSAVRSVFIAFDNDEAGHAAAGPLAESLILAGKAVYRVDFPVREKDANGLAVAADDPAAALGAALRDARYLGGPARVAVPGLPAGPALPALPQREPAEPSSLAAFPVPPTASAVPVPRAPVAAPIPALARAPASPAAALSRAPARELPPAVSAAALPGAAAPGVVTAHEDEHRAAFGPRGYRILGLIKNPDAVSLKVNLRLTVTSAAGDERWHQDTVDLCQAKQRAAFVAAATAATSADPEAIRGDLGRLLDGCESAWKAGRAAAAAPARRAAPPPIPPEREAAARALLRAPDLLALVGQHYHACGVVGDVAPMQVSYLCGVSRKLDAPLAVLTMAPSAAGKTSLQDATLAFIPEEDRLAVSAMTGQALHYLEEDLAHKILAISEEEGASRATYSLKLLQSEGKLSLMVPIKDAESGQIATTIKTVQGPVALFLTSTAVELNEELSNRCIVLTVDDSPEQTARIHAAQRDKETLAGLLGRQRAAGLRQLHQDAQRLLEPVAVVNPFAPFLSFRADQPRSRRDHMKYLGLIRAITFVHQHQLPRQEVIPEGGGPVIVYVESTLDHIEAANRLAAATFGRSLDELAPQTRSLLLCLDTLASGRAAAEGCARDAVRFTRRSIREAIGWSPNQVRDHLARLIELEYVLPTRGGGQGQRTEFAVIYEGQGKDGGAFVLGLTGADEILRRLAGGGVVAADATATAGTLSPQTTHFVPTSSPVCPPIVPTCWEAENGVEPTAQCIPFQNVKEHAEKGSRGGLKIRESNRSHTAEVLAGPGHNGHASAAAAALPGVALAVLDDDADPEDGR